MAPGAFTNTTPKNSLQSAAGKLMKSEIAHHVYLQAQHLMLTELRNKPFSYWHSCLSLFLSLTLSFSSFSLSHSVLPSSSVSPSDLT